MKIDRVDLCPTICAEYIQVGDCFSVPGDTGVWMRTNALRREVTCVSLQTGVEKGVPLSKMVVPLDVTAQVKIRVQED